MMRPGWYRADLLLPGDQLEHGAVVKDCVGDGADVLLEIRRTDGTVTVIRLPREMPVLTNYRP